MVSSGSLLAAHQQCGGGDNRQPWVNGCSHHQQIVIGPEFLFFVEDYTTAPQHPDRAFTMTLIKSLEVAVSATDCWLLIAFLSEASSVKGGGKMSVFILVGAVSHHCSFAYS